MKTSIQDQILKQKIQEHTEQLEQRRKELVKQKHKEYELEGINEEFLWKVNAEKSELRENKSLDDWEVSLFKDTLITNFKHPTVKRRQSTKMKTFIENEYPTIKEKILRKIQSKAVPKQRDLLDLELIDKFTEEDLIDLIAQLLAREQFIEKWKDEKKKGTNLIESTKQKSDFSIEEEPVHGFNQYQQILFFEALFHLFNIQSFNARDVYEFALLFKGEKPDKTRQKSFAKAYINAFSRESEKVQEDYQKIIDLLDRQPSNINTLSNKLKGILKKRKDNQ